MPRPYHSGPINLTEDLAVPGKINPDEIWIEARGRWYEILHGPDIFTCMQAGAARLVTRGDDVMDNFDVLDRTQAAARVRRVSGSAITITNGLGVAQIMIGLPVTGTRDLVSVYRAPCGADPKVHARPGNTALAFCADAAFDGAVDDVTLYLETAACAPAGPWDYFITPKSSDGVIGALVGPISTEIK